MPRRPWRDLPASVWQSGGQAEKDAAMTLTGIQGRSRTLIGTPFPACHIEKNVARRLAGVAVAQGGCGVNQGQPLVHAQLCQGET